MLEAKAKAEVRSRIETVLAAINNIRNIIKEAADAGDFITLNLICDDGENPLKDLEAEASDALDNMTADIADSENEGWEWWSWADQQFPNTEPFLSMANEAANHANEE